MIAYAYINDLFKAVLGKSKAIGGRFYISIKDGNEINMDNLGEVIQDVVAKAASQKYPLCIMIPPRSVSDLGKDGWDEYTITMFFLKQTFVDSNNQVSVPNISTRTSTHTVMMDWHDMKRAAAGFVRSIDILQRKKSLHTQFRLMPSTRIITPVSMVGQDRLSGVRLDFKASLFIGCELEDYLEDDITNLVLPVGDSHPEHNL